MSERRTAASMTPSAPCVEVPTSFVSHGWKIPAALTLPVAAERGGDVEAAVLLVPGSLFSDVNGDYPAWQSYPHVYGHLARQLSARGMAVYRFAKLGPGTGSEMIDEPAAKAVRNWDGRLAIARDALAAMAGELTACGIRARARVLAGHSEGAVIVSRMAVERPGDGAPSIDGVVLLSGPSVGILSIMREQLGTFLPPEQLEEALRNLDAAIAAIMAGEPIDPELGQRPGVQGLFGTGPAGWRYLSDCERCDPTALAARIGQPVLIIQGGADGSVPPHHAERLASSRGTRSTEMAILDGLSHMYKRVPPEVTGPAAFGYPGETDPRVAATIAGWVKHLR